MASQPAPKSQGKSVTSIVHHVLKMPRWQQGLLTIAIVTLGGGLAGQGVAYLPGHSTTQQSDEASGPHNTFFGGGTTQPSDQPVPFWQRIAPRLTAVGFSFVVGFVVGWLMRTFVKLGTTIAVLAVAALLCLSYFKVLNLDLSKAQVEYKDAKEWITDQAQRAGKALATHLPSSVSTLAGVLIGFRRK